MKHGTKEHREHMRKIAAMPKPTIRGENNPAKRPDVRKKISLAVRNENHGGWKGDAVGYNALHAWVKRHKKKSKLCRKCRKEKLLDLCNKSGNYMREITDWEWLCRRCHMKSDGRLEKFKKYVGRNKPSVGIKKLS